MTSLFESDFPASVLPASLNIFQVDPKKRLADRVTRLKSGATILKATQVFLIEKFNIKKIEQAHQIHMTTTELNKDWFGGDDEAESLFDWLNDKKKSSQKVPDDSRTFKKAAADYAQYLSLVEALKKQTKKPKDILTSDELKELKEKIQQDQSPERTAEINQLIEVLGDKAKFADYYFGRLEPALKESMEEMKKKYPDLSEEEIKEMVLKDFREKELTIRLVITDIEGYNSNFLQKKFVRWFCSWGINHTALQIGPYLLEWNTGELVAPRSLRSNGVVARFRFMPITLSADQVIQKVSDVCVDFNLNRTYSRLGSNFNSNGANCQSFVDAIISALGLQNFWSTKGPIAHYLDLVRSNRINGPTDFAIWHGGEPPQTHINNHPELREFYEKYCVVEKETRSEAFRLELEMMVKSIERCLQMQVRHALKSGDTDKVQRLWPDKERNPPIFRPSNVKATANTAIHTNTAQSSSKPDPKNSPDTDAVVLNRTRQTSLVSNTAEGKRRFFGNVSAQESDDPINEMVIEPQRVAASSNDPDNDDNNNASRAASNFPNFDDDIVPEYETELTGDLAFAFAKYGK